MIEWNVSIEEKIEQICQFLFKNTEIKNFFYAKILDDDQGIVLSNNAQWVNYHKEKGYSLFILPKNLPAGSKCYYLSSREDLGFNVFSPFDIIIFNPPCYEIFSFAMDKPIAGVANYYFNQRHFLEKFSVFFKSEIESWVEKGLVKFLNLSPIHRVPFPFNFDEKSVKQDFFNLIPACKFTFHIHEKRIKFSVREIDCIKQLVKGYTVKQMAVFLGVSDRTVETYLNSIKAKLNCQKTQILEILRADPFFNMLLMD